MRSKAPPLGLLLAPGAGADRDHPALIAIDDAATSAGALVVRMDFPYRRAGRRAPDRAPVLLGAVVAEATELDGRCDPLVVGGRSMGGRMCSLAVADGMVAAGLVLVSYPLHPPGRLDKMRDAHFPGLNVPCLFVSGTKDTFATQAELAAASSTIPGVVTHEWVVGGDHSLRRFDAVVARLVVGWLAQTFDIDNCDSDDPSGEDRRR